MMLAMPSSIGSVNFLIFSTSPLTHVGGPVLFLIPRCESKDLIEDDELPINLPKNEYRGILKGDTMPPLSVGLLLEFAQYAA